MAAALIAGVGFSAWLLWGGTTTAQSGEGQGTQATTPTTDQASPATNGEVNTPVAPVTGPTVDAATAFVAGARQTIHPLRGAARYAAIRETWEKSAAMLEGPMSPKARAVVLPLFNEITDILFFSEYRNEFSIVYMVKRGDSVEKIAKAHGVTEELICLWNKIDYAKRGQIREGQSFKIVASAPRLVVSKEQFTLSFYFGERLARQYIIAHGVGNSTPVGSATVNSKVVDPDQGPHAGAMQQEMDERWIGLSSIDEGGVARNGIGIHGTKYEDSIPGETSHGCVRMFNRDVVELYAWVPRGMSVEIRD